MSPKSSGLIFVERVSRLTEQFIGEEPSSIIALLPDGIYYAQALYGHLRKKRKDVNWTSYDVEGNILDKEKLRGRKVLLVDNDTRTGATAQKAKHQLLRMQKELQFTGEIKLAVFDDFAGVADFYVYQPLRLKAEFLRGRFSGKKQAEKLAQEYTASIFFDQRLYRHDIQGSIAHAKMLAKQHIITQENAEHIVNGLISILEEIDRGEFQFNLEFNPELEDIHMAIEYRLFEKIGEVADKLHTARSRNDQVELDMRLFAKEAISETLGGIKEFQRALVTLAESNKDVIMPGYTHLQRAQPVLLAHHLLAYFEMFQRDLDRFSDCLKRTDVMPLGSGAVVGVAYDIDRDFLAKELGFSQLSQNSMDAVSDRDFIVEYEAAASIGMMHLSRLAEEIILWSSTEFDFVELDEAYATGSSIMPQKKNPDVAELVRGKTGRVYGALMALLTTMKGLPLSYNRDMQEDKEGFFATVDTLLSSLEVFSGMLKTLRIKAENAGQAAQQGYILATDLADYLVKKGEAFRTAHNIMGRLVSYATEKGKSFSELSLSEYKRFSPLFGDDVYLITVESSLAARDNTGGTAPRQVAEALVRAKKMVNL